MTAAQKLISELRQTLTAESEALEAMLTELSAAIRAEPIGAIRNRLVERRDEIIHRLTTIDIALAG